MPTALGSGLGRQRVIAWDLRGESFGVHASAASLEDIRLAVAEMGHNGLSISIVQQTIFNIVGATQGHLAENIYSLGIANAALGHTVVAPGQTGLHLLNITGVSQGETATPIILVKNLPAANASQGETSDPIVLVKNLPAAVATQGHQGTALQITLTVGSPTMGVNGLAVAFPAGGAASLTVVAATQPMQGYAPMFAGWDIGCWELQPNANLAVLNVLAGHNGLAVAMT